MSLRPCIEALAAGFLLDGESPLLHNADDAHALKVFDPAIRGRTDQFMLRFRKPL
jgi:predicted methyltransferase